MFQKSIRMDITVRSGVLSADSGVKQFPAGLDSFIYGLLIEILISSLDYAHV